MALGTRELYLVLRARDEASRVLRNAGNNIRDLNKEQIAAARQQMQIGQGLATAGVALVFAGAAAVSWFKEATDAAIAYNQEAAKTLTQADNIGATLENVKRIGRDVAKAIPAPFEQMQTGLYDIFSSMDVGIKEAEMLLTEFSRAAVAGQVDLQAASRATISILNAYKLPATEVNRVNDVMFQLVRKGVGTYDEFAKTIGRAIPSSVRAGQSIETLAGMMAFLTRNGLSTSMAATSAARALDAFSHPKTVERLQEMGVAVRDAKGQFLPLTDILGQLSAKMSEMTAPERAAALQDLFKSSGGTIQARRFIDMAINNFDEFNQRVKEMGNSKGAMQDAYDIMFKQPQSQMQLLSNRWEILRTEVGDFLIPSLLKLVTAGLKLLEMWNKLSPGMQKNIVMVVLWTSVAMILLGVITAVVGVVLMLLAAATLAGIGIGALAAIIGGVIAGLVILGVAIWAIIKYHREIGDVAVAAWHGIQDAFSATLDYMRPIVEWAERIYEMFARNLGPVLQQFWDQLKAAGRDALPPLLEAWDSLKSSFTEMGESLKPLLPVLHLLAYVLGAVIVVALVALAAAIMGTIILLGDMLGPVVKGIAQIIQGLVQIIAGTIQFFVAVLTGNWAAAWDACKKITQGFVNVVIGLWHLLVGTTKAVVQQLIDWVVAGFKWLYNVLVGHSIIPDMINAITKWVNKLGNDMPAIIRAMIGLVIAIFLTLPARAIMAVASLVPGLTNKGREAISRMGDAIKAGVGRIVGIIAGLANSLVSSVTSIGSRMYNAGASLMNQVASGIRSAAGAVTGAAGDVLSKVRNMLPGSPIKDGPLKKWNNGGAGIRLMKMLGSGIRLGQPSVMNELGRVMNSLAAAGDSGVINYASRVSGVSEGLSDTIGGGGTSYAGGGGGTQQNFYITTQEIDPRKHAADLGWEMMAGTPS